MSKIQRMFSLATQLAKPRKLNDLSKNHWFGCVGIRSDNAIVYSRNIPAHIGKEAGSAKIKAAHAEARLVQKLDYGSEIYVVRIAKKKTEDDSSTFLIARPCCMCETVIRSKKIRRVYYSINNDQYGVWDPIKNVDRVYSL